MNTVYVKLVATAVAFIIIAAAYLGLVDSAGRDYTDAGFKRALITYGVARALNGVISVAQGTEVAFEPAGIGLTFAPGEILDPANDLIERFSWVVLVSGTSLGIQQVLINVTASTGFSIVVSVALLVGVVFLWLSQRVPTGVRWLAYRLCILLVIIRFAVPVMAICSDTLYVHFLAQQYLESQQQLNVTATRIRTLTEANQPTLPEQELSLLEKTKRVYQSASDAVDVRKRIAALKTAATDLSEYAIDLIVVFVMETILFPLLFLWLIMQLAKRVALASHKTQHADG